MRDPAAHIGPTVTVLIPAYNAARYIAEAVHSVLQQTFADLELLVIDDGSTDDTPAIMAGITDPRVRYVRHVQNRGLVAVLNEGLDTATGTYIARMDADDVMHRDRLEKQVRFMEAHPAIAAVASFVELINADGEVTGPWDTDRETPDEVSIRAMLPRTNCIAHPSVTIRRSLLGDMRYAPDQHGAEDWDLWMRMLARGLRIAKIPEPLLSYRMHPSSVMAGAKRKVPLEVRLLRTRRRFIAGEWGHGRVSRFHVAVLKAQARTWTRHWISNILPAFARNAYRLLTYSPFALLRERRVLRAALAHWQGRHAFAFPYLNTGGAEQVHADIMATVADQRPIIFITGFSKDRSFAERFARIGTLVETPHLLHHPFTARSARRRIVNALNAREQPVLFGANTAHLIHWGEQLRPDGKLLLLIHAFLYQPEGNRIHKQWLPLFPRMDRYVFIARQAMVEYERFLLASHIPRSALGKLIHIPNAVHSFGSVGPHTAPGVLFVGRDSAEKRLGLFLRIADEVHRAAPGAFRFTVMGADPRSGHGHVRFLGTIADAAERDRIYADHDVLALTSDREGFPMVIMEAMAQGLAILSTPVGDVPNRVDPRFGMITSTTEPDDVAREMSETLMALGRDHGRLQAMRHAALAEARAQFSMERLRQHYRELLMSPSAES